MAKKFDGVIEAVRYKNGQISFVRAFERRGSTFSDHLVLDRKTLLERLQKGKVFVTGSREDLLASTFQVSKPVLLVKANEREFISTREGTEHDELENVPLF
ncbi:MAG TPA: hypothetical protein PK152_14560 [Anaerolineales bacterium]|jgi:Zn-dependent peptidase ImmA (M78 family)|nr:hypothetical protein [Anaerolineae bacterium]HRJ56785.1 hypothetical protein [Anaerolineales bacterium]HRK90355.1 hypothetical protein [Anaerolineales bacterium]